MTTIRLKSIGKGARHRNSVHKEAKRLHIDGELGENYEFVTLSDLFHFTGYIDSTVICCFNVNQ